MVMDVISVRRFVTYRALYRTHLTACHAPHISTLRVIMRCVLSFAPLISSLFARLPRSDRSCARQPVHQASRLDLTPHMTLISHQKHRSRSIYRYHIVARMMAWRRGGMASSGSRKQRQSSAASNARRHQRRREPRQTRSSLLGAILVAACWRHQRRTRSLCVNAWTSAGRRNLNVVCVISIAHGHRTLWHAHRVWRSNHRWCLIRHARIFRRNQA